MKRPVHILMVDDDAIEVEAVRRAFKRAGLANPLLSAADGIEALELLRSVAPWPTLVLLDLNMPRMNGIEFLDAVRNDPTLSPTVVFVVTTSDEESDKAAAYGHHVCGFLVKEKLGDGFRELTQIVRDYTQSVEFPPKPSLPVL